MKRIYMALIFIVLIGCIACGKDSSSSQAGIYKETTDEIVTGIRLVRAEEREKLLAQMEKREEDSVVADNTSNGQEEEVTEDVQEEKQENTESDKPKELVKEEVTQPAQPTAPTQPETTQPTTPVQPTTPTQPVHTHSYSVSAQTAATCTAAGSTTYVCSCGHSYSNSNPALGHDEYREIDVEPSCNYNGIVHIDCLRCGKCWTEDIPATGKHNYQLYDSQNATCGTSGYNAYKCSGCGDTYKDTIQATGAHSIYEYEEGTAYWTKHTYIKVTACNDCGMELSRTEVKNCERYGDYQTIEGEAVYERQYKCNVCGYEWHWVPW